MEECNMWRRAILRTTGVAIAEYFRPSFAYAASGSRVRLEWKQFRQSSQYASFLNAIAAMRRNTNPADQGSLQYWAAVHQQFCPHGVSYFVSWHRGYLYYFEQQLRISSGDPTLNLPYWDYYLYPIIPSEFTDTAASNPLYVPRNSTNVYNALDLSPFSSTVYNFQRGTTNAFEVRIETAPHNAVHDLIGGIMSTMQSPLDPIFYLHHANIDRLTHAWALPDGKGIPYTTYPYSSTTSSPYWAGLNTYASDLTIDRYKTCDPTWLGYDYSNDAPPSSMPPLAQTASLDSTSLTLSQPIPNYERPPLVDFQKIPGERRSRVRYSMGGLGNVSFSENSFRVQIQFTSIDAATLARVIEGRRNNRDNSEMSNYSLKLVLDGVFATEVGRSGGYFFEVFVNMPRQVETIEERITYLVGAIGPYQIAAASHHGNRRIELDLTEALTRQSTTNYETLELSMIRIDGDRPPRGRVIFIPQVRLELSQEDSLIKRWPEPAARPSGWYR